MVIKCFFVANHTKPALLFLLVKHHSEWRTLRETSASGLLLCSSLRTVPSAPTRFLGGEYSKENDEDPIDM